MMKSYCDPSIDIQKKPHFLLQDSENRYKDRRNHILLLINLDDFKEETEKTEPQYFGMDDF
jgi:hypothetical protein